MNEFIAQMWFQAKVHREDGDPNCEADAAAYTWAAIDATLHQDAEFTLTCWIRQRLETLPQETFEDDTILDIRATARDIQLGQVSGGRL